MISKRLLIHTVNVLHPSGTDRDGNKTYTITVLNHVRVDYSQGVQIGIAGAQTADTMTLYLDPARAEYTDTKGEPADAIVPAEGDTVVYSGTPYEVRKVTPRSTQGGAAVHHDEVELV